MPRVDSKQTKARNGAPASLMKPRKLSPTGRIVYVLLRIDTTFDDTTPPVKVIDVFQNWHSARFAIWPDFKELIIQECGETEEEIEEKCDDDPTYKDGQVVDDDSNAFSYSQWMYEIRRRLIKP